MTHKANISNTYSGANNNIDFTYYSAMSNIDADYTFKCIVSGISINTHVDRISFNCFHRLDESVQWLFRTLNNEINNYSCTKDESVKSGMYKRKRIYVHNENNIEITILYDRKASYFSYYPDIKIFLDDPDIYTIDWLYFVCNVLEFTTTLTYVELAIDFSPPVDILKEYFSRNLVLKNHRGGCKFVNGSKNNNKNDKSIILYSNYVDKGDSFYIGHKDKNSKSIILYTKKIDDNNNVLRQEFRLKRNFLYQL